MMYDMKHRTDIRQTMPVYESDMPEMGRRDFLKMSLKGAGIVAVAAGTGLMLHSILDYPKPEDYDWELREYFNPRADENVAPWPWIRENFTDRWGYSTAEWRDMITHYNREHGDDEFSWGRMYNGRKLLVPVREKGKSDSPEKR